MAIEVDGRVIETDAEGYLVEPSDWDQAVAEEFSRQEKIDLTEAHWIVINFMRDYYDEHQVIADARFAIKHLREKMGIGSAAQAEMFKLFPYGYVRQACKIAGMRRPRAWSTG